MSILISNIVVVIIVSLLIAFMNKNNKSDNLYNSDDSDFKILDCKRNVKIVMTTISLLSIIVFPLLSIITIIKDNTDETELIIISTLFLIAGLFVLIGMKYQKIIYKDGKFIKKSIFGKKRIYKFDNVIKAKYKENNSYKSVTLYTNNNKKLEICSYLTNFDWVLKEIKIRGIDIYN